MQKEKEDAVISVAMVTGSTQALCKFGLLHLWALLSIDTHAAA